MKTPQLALMVLSLVGCGIGYDAPAPDVILDGVAVSYSRSNVSWANAEDLSAAWHDTVQAALDHWGGNWDTLRSWTVVFEDGLLDCGDITGIVIGCAWFDDRALVISSWASPYGPTKCLEQTSLVHEIGHAIIGDAHHTDSRWNEWDDVWQKLHEPARQHGCYYLDARW